MSDAYRDVRRGIRDAKDWPTAPRGSSGVGGLGATQTARRSLEAQERAAVALEEVRDIARATAEALAPIAVQIAEAFGPALAQLAADVRKLVEAVTASLEYSPLDTPGDRG